MLYFRKKGKYYATSFTQLQPILDSEISTALSELRPSDCGPLKVRSPLVDPPINVRKAQDHVRTPERSVVAAGTHGAIGKTADVQELLFRKMMGIAAAAHELKTPLSLLCGYTQLLLDGSLGGLNEQQHRVLQEMASGTARLQRFVNDFLAFGAMESGKLVPNLELRDVNAIVEETLQIWAARFESCGKHLSFKPAPHLPQVPCDELKIQHVLSNLLDNALKFTPPNGTVTASTRSHFWERRIMSRPQENSADRRKQADRRHNSVRVDVRDSGPGVPAEDHIEIFSEFKKSRLSAHAEGIGLGLAIAKRLVDAHDGKIWVESGKKSGALFSFLLPYCRIGERNERM